MSAVAVTTWRSRAANFFLAAVVGVMSSCAAPVTVPARPTDVPARDVTALVGQLLVSHVDLPPGFVQTGERSIGVVEVADDEEERATVRAHGREGGWERTFVPKQARDDGVIFVQAWVSAYADPAGATWAMSENVVDTRNESADPFVESSIPGIAQDAVLFDVSTRGELITAVAIVYFRTGCFASGVLVAGGDNVTARDLAVEVARRQAAKQFQAV